MGRREQLVGAQGVSEAPPPKPAPGPQGSGPSGRLESAPPPVQVVPRVRCPRCKSRSIRSYKTDGNIRHVRCLNGCLEEGGGPLHFKVLMV